MIKNFVTLFWVCLNVALYSQSHDENHRKYWYYKSRLNNDFVLVGTGPGMSLPINERGMNSTGGTGYYGDPNDHQFYGVKIGDATSTLGLYLGVLATEYRLLKNNGQTSSIPRINHELYCALYAINRLDYSAETIFGGSPSLNGFFIRDDVPNNFLVDNYAHFNYYNSSSNSQGNAIDGSSSHALISSQPDAPNSNTYLSNPANYLTDHGFLSVMPYGSFVVNSDYQAWQENSINTDFVVSQDQIHALMMGLALVAKLVDANETDNSTNFGGSAQPYLAAEAKIITARIINYIKNSNGCNDLPWKVKNPFTCSDVPRGANAVVYGYPFSQSACFVVNGGDLPADAHAPIPINCYSFSDNLNYNQSIAGYDAWQSLVLVSGGLDNDQQAFFNYAASVCNCLFLEATDPVVAQELAVLQTILDDLCGFFGCPSSVIDEVNYLLGILNRNFNVTGLDLVLNESTWPIPAGGSGGASGPFDGNYTGSKMFHGAYVHGLLHGIIANDYTSESAFTLNNTMKDLIDAGPCEGNYNFGNYQWGDREWSSDNRLEHTNRIGETNTAGNKLFPAEYNGLDFMFYHNLYYLFNYNNDSRIVNLSDRNVDFTIPVSSEYNTIGNSTLPSGLPNTNDGSHANPSTLGAFETIEADNLITQNADITYRAGKTIHFTSNSSQQFHVENGALFHAVIGSFTCGSGDYSRVANQDTSSKKNSYTQTDMYTRPTHGTGPIDWSVVKNQPAKPLTTTQTDSITTVIKKIAQSLDILSKVEVSPNPNDGRFSLKSTVGIYNYTVTDVMGNTIEVGQLKNKETIFDLSRCKPGIYFINLDDGRGYTQTKKVLIN